MNAKIRFTIFAVALALLFCVLGGSMADLQLRQGEEYYAQSQSGKQRTITLKGERGKILDTNGLPLAYNQKLSLIHILSFEGKVTGLTVGTNSETPGLGANATKEEFRNLFVEKDQFPLEAVSYTHLGGNFRHGRGYHRQRAAANAGADRGDQGFQRGRAYAAGIGMDHGQRQRGGVAAAAGALSHRLGTGKGAGIPVGCIVQVNGYLALGSALSLIHIFEDFVTPLLK